jgi:hypothetical protein
MMHKILKQVGKKVVNSKSKELRIEEKAYLLSMRLHEGLNTTREV